VAATDRIDNRARNAGAFQLLERALHTQRHGWSTSGNTPGDHSTARRCGAKTGRATACQGPAMRTVAARYGSCALVVLRFIITAAFGRRCIPPPP
jgi:hypothetical protein